MVAEKKIFGIVNGKFKPTVLMLILIVIFYRWQSCEKAVIEDTEDYLWKCSYYDFKRNSLVNKLNNIGVEFKLAFVRLKIVYEV